MNLGAAELVLLAVLAISMLGPVIAGVYLATRLSGHRDDPGPDARPGSPGAA